MQARLKSKSQRKALLIKAIYLIFFLIMLLQHAYIYMYHDDFGYATLSYFGDLTNDIPGRKFNISQMLNFLSKHYLTWGGRVLPFFTLLTLLRWPFWIYRIVQSVVLTLIIYSCSKFINGKDQTKDNFFIISLILMSLYGLIPIQLHQNGTYWATAAVLYVWPFLWIYGASILLNSDKVKANHWLMILLALMFLGIGLMHEQIFFVAIFLLMGFLINHFLKNKSFRMIKIYLLCIFFLVAGFLILVLSPGNIRRSNSPLYQDFYALSLISRVKYNIPSFLQITFGRQNLIFFVVLLLINFLFLKSSHQIKSSKKPFYWAALISQSILMLIIIVILFSSLPLKIIDDLRAYIYPVLSITHSIWFWLVFLMLVSIPGFIFCFYQRSFGLLGIYIGGIIAQLTNLFIPTINMRSSLIFMFSLFPLMTAMFTKTLNNFERRWIKALVLFVIIFLALTNTISIISGYQKNSSIHQENQKSLICSHIAIQQGQDIQKIYLNKLEDDQYAGAMPYTEGYDYINYWIKDYFEIPLDVDLIWQ